MTRQTDLPTVQVGVIAPQRVANELDSAVTLLEDLASLIRDADEDGVSPDPSRPTPRDEPRPRREATETAPTAAEIRESLRRRAHDYPSDCPANALREVIEDWARWLSAPAFDALESTDPREPGLETEDDDAPLWTNLRASEAVVLDSLVKTAERDAFRRCEAAISEELVKAGMAFAQAFPEAPRPRVIGK